MSCPGMASCVTPLRVRRPVSGQARQCPHCRAKSAQLFRSTTNDWRCMRGGAIDDELSQRPTPQIAAKCTRCGSYLSVDKQTRIPYCPTHGTEDLPDVLAEFRGVQHHLS